MRVSGLSFSSELAECRPSSPASSSGSTGSCHQSRPRYVRLCKKVMTRLRARSMAVKWTSVSPTDYVLSISRNGRRGGMNASPTLSPVPSRLLDVEAFSCRSMHVVNISLFRVASSRLDYTEKAKPHSMPLSTPSYSELVRGVRSRIRALFLLPSSVASHQ